MKTKGAFSKLRYLIYKIHHQVFSFKANLSNIQDKITQDCCFFQNITFIGKKCPNFEKGRVEAWEQIGTKFLFFPNAYDFPNFVMGGRTLIKCYILHIIFD